jgi:hypothetical protein
MYRPPPRVVEVDKSGLGEGGKQGRGGNTGEGGYEDAEVSIQFDLSSLSTRYPQTRINMGEVCLTFCL